MIEDYSVSSAKVKVLQSNEFVVYIIIVEYLYFSRPLMLCSCFLNELTRVIVIALMCIICKSIHVALRGRGQV